MPYFVAVSKLRRPFLFDRYFFIVVRLLKRREKFTEPDFALLPRAFNRARALHPFYLTAWVFLPDHWHAIGAHHFDSRARIWSLITGPKRFGSRRRGWGGGKRARTVARAGGEQGSSIDVDLMSLRVGNQDNFVRPQRRSLPPKCKVGLDLWPQGDARRRLPELGGTAPCPQ